jgi:hypothetical protein
MLYILIIVGAMMIITLINSLLLGSPSLQQIGGIALSTLLGTISVIVWDGIVALLIRRLPLPKRWFAPESPLFCVGKRERSFYRNIGINAWKNHVPELGCFTGFHKSEFTSPSDPAYLARFLLESNYGVAIHFANALLGFLIILLPWCSRPAIALPIALVNMILSLLPVAVLRFNTVPLRNIYLRKTQKTN